MASEVILCIPQVGDASEDVPTDNKQEEEKDVKEEVTLEKIATVKERMDNLSKAKRAHPPLEKKTSSKLKIPDVFQSPQTSPLSKHNVLYLGSYNFIH